MRASPRTIGDPQWVNMTRRTLAASHQPSCSVMGACPTRVLFFLRTIERLMVAPSPTYSSMPRKTFDAFGRFATSGRWKKELALPDTRYPTAGARIECWTGKAFNLNPAIVTVLRNGILRRSPMGKRSSKRRVSDVA